MSIINDLQAAATRGQPVPEVGMGATVLLATDRRAATIIRVFKDRGRDMVSVQRDIAKCVSGSVMAGDANYAYERNDIGQIQTFRFDGVRWCEVRLSRTTGRWQKLSGAHLMIGRRDEYYDPHF